MGSNKTPDYRECAIVGIGTNGTNTIATHETYTLGEFKDDQIQDHTHVFGQSGTNYQYSANCAPGNGGRGFMPTGSDAFTTPIRSGRHGSVTRGKRKGALICIKAL